MPHRILLPANKFDDLMLGSPGLISYWPEGERSGTVAVDRMGLHNGVYTGSPALGVRAGYNDLDTAITTASGKYVAIANDAKYHFGTTGAMSWARWIYPTASAALSWWFAKGDGSGYEWGMGRGVLPFNAGTGVLCTVWQSNGNSVVIAGTASGTVPDNKWSRILVTCNAAALKIYVNGRLSAQSTSFTGTPGSATSAVNIGRRPDNSGPFLGSGARSSIWNRALGPGEAADDYYAAVR